MALSNLILDSLEYRRNLLKHIIRDSETMAQALRYGVTADHFKVNEATLNIYPLVASQALQFGVAPIDLDTMKCGLVPHLQLMDVTILPLLSDFIFWVYSSELSPKVYSDSVRAFVRRCEERRIAENCSGDLNLLNQSLNELNLRFTRNDSDINLASFPFKNLVLPEIKSLIPTGLHIVDKTITGLDRGEYVILLGFTGSGKTALASFLARNWAFANYNVAYCSFEETVINMSYRLYSGMFRIPYSDLRRGTAIPELTQKFYSDDPDAVDIRNIMNNRLCLQNFKQEGRLDIDQIHAQLATTYEKEGFQPDIVIIDQMQFLSAKTSKKSEQQWEVEKKISTECDELSHMTIGGKPYVLLVLHQVKGKPKEYFSREDIDGFKGIDHKADWMWGLGRNGDAKAKLGSNKFTFFSLKERHSAPFDVVLYGELKYMNFTDQAPSQNIVKIPEVAMTADGQLIEPATVAPTFNPVLPLSYDGKSPRQMLDPLV